MPDENDTEISEEDRLAILKEINSFKFKLKEFLVNYLFNPLLWLPAFFVFGAFFVDYLPLTSEFLKSFIIMVLFLVPFLILILVACFTGKYEEDETEEDLNQ